VARLSSSWDTYEFGARAGEAAAPRPRGVPVYLPPMRDVPGVGVRIEVAGVPETALLSAGRVLPSGVWALEPEDLPRLRMLPAAMSAGRLHHGPVSLQVTFIATNLATGRSGNMVTTVDIPAVWSSASAGDRDAVGGVRYSLADDAGGLFEIDPVSGLVALADDSLLDAATARRHRIAVQMLYPNGSAATRRYEIELIGEAGEFAVTELWDRNAGRQSGRQSTRQPARQHVRPGAIVGTVSVPVDINAADVLRFRLLDDAEGRFAIGEWTGVVTVADASLFAGAAGWREIIAVEVSSAEGWMSVQELSITPGDRKGSFAVAVLSHDAAADDADDAWLPAPLYLPRPAA
jgi:hypothetical protein